MRSGPSAKGQGTRPDDHQNVFRDQSFFNGIKPRKRARLGNWQLGAVLYRGAESIPRSNKFQPAHA